MCILIQMRHMPSKDNYFFYCENKQNCLLSSNVKRKQISEKDSFLLHLTLELKKKTTVDSIYS